METTDFIEDIFKIHVQQVHDSWNRETLKTMEEQNSVKLCVSKQKEKGFERRTEKAFFYQCGFIPEKSTTKQLFT